MKDFNVSQHFTFWELTKSKDHPELVEENREHFIVEPYLTRLMVASEYLLENIRLDLDIPIYVLSGGRCPALNNAVGGVKDSQHLFERYHDGAFDITTKAITITELGDYITDQSSLCWHQLRIYLKRGFVHLSMPLGHNDGQVTVIK